MTNDRPAVPRRDTSAPRALAFPIAMLLGTVLAGTPSARADEAPAADAVASASLTDEREAERARFVEARDALASGDRARFLALEKTLVDYPLHDYLTYARLRERFRREAPTEADARTVEAFEEASGDAVLAGRLVRTLQDRFAEREEWAAFLAIKASRHANARPCTTLVAREATAPPSAFDEGTLALWSSPERRPASCDAALEALERRSPVPTSAVWERIYAAMAANRPEAARPALGLLATRDRRPVEGWIAGIENPVRHLAAGALDADTALNRRIIADLVMRWSREDTAAAMAYWQGARTRFAFSDELRHDTDRALAMRAAYRRMPEAERWIDAFEAREDDLELMEWRIRTSLLAGNWPEVVRRIERLPVEEQEEDHWAYWVARAHEVAGRDEDARRIHARLAELQSWHGFLSAERLGRPHAIEDVPVRPSEAELARLATDPVLVRALEYHRVGLAHEGRREWNAWLSGRRDADEIAAAAVLASRWGLDDRAIFSAGRAGDGARRALALRFPALHRDAIEREAAGNDLESALVYGVARRESAWIPDIRSSAGAIGLMQLMPATATDVARLRGEKGWNGDLTDPATNIAFGTFYLAHVRARFDGHRALAAASYNAGPHRVAKWLPEDGPMEADRWIDTIPYTETRRYVRAVLAYAAIYERRLNGRDYGLLERLPPVPSPAGATVGDG